MKLFELRLLLVVALPVFAGCGVPDETEIWNEEDVQVTEDALTSCKIFNYTPTLSNGRVHARTRLWCPTTRTKLWVKTYLSRNNVGVAENPNTCDHNFECNAYTSFSNTSGSQKWCTHGNGQINDSTLVGGSAVCEGSSW